MIKNINRVEEVFDFVWELSQNDLYAGYPRKKDMEEIKKCIEKAINAECENIIACYHENVLCGVCIYHWICDEKYVQTTQLLIKDNYDKIADEIISYISKKLHGYELLIPLPFSNKNANEYFKRKNIECIEAHINTRLYNLKGFEDQKNEKNNCIEKITYSNFQEYAIFHDKYAIPFEMYYKSSNIKKEMERFIILAFREAGAIHGSIFAKTGEHAEIVGIFIDDAYQDKGLTSILINELINELYKQNPNTKELIFLVEEDNDIELNAALDAGFEIKGRARTYKCLL